MHTEAYEPSVPAAHMLLMHTINVNVVRGRSFSTRKFVVQMLHAVINLSNTTYDPM
jgi:hypothetical protein